MGWRTMEYGPRVMSSCSLFSVMVPLQLRPIVNRAHKANAAPASASATPAHATAGVSGTNRAASAPRTGTRFVISTHALTLRPS